MADELVGPAAYRQRIKRLRGGQLWIEVWFRISDGAAVASRRTLVDHDGTVQTKSTRTFEPGWARRGR